MLDCCFHRRARACPSPCTGRRNGLGRRVVFARVDARGGNPLGCACGIRGPPRYGEKNAAPSRRARACPSPCLIAAFTVGRGPVPRHAPGGETALAGGWFSRGLTLAGDRPPRYEKKRFPFLVGRGPSHATRASERVSLAIVRAHAIQRSRGTGPRATGKNQDQEVSPTGENGIVTILTTTS